MSPDRVRVASQQVAPDPVAELAVMAAAKIASDRVPVEQLGVERSVGAAVECIGQHLLGAGVRRGASFLETSVGFAQGKHVEKIGGRGGVDVAIVLVAAVITDDHGRQPDDVQLPDMRITEIDPQGNERLRDGGDDGGVWIRHGIQQFAADSVILFDVDQEQPPLLPGAMNGRVPVTLPGNTMLLHGDHERLRSSTLQAPTDGVDFIADSDALGRIGGAVRYTFATFPRLLEDRGEAFARRMSDGNASP